jgi:hypothetical protein
MVHSLARCIPNMPPYSVQWIEENVVCAIPTEECYFNQCENCCNGKRLQVYALCDNDDDDDIGNEEVEVLLWEKRKNEQLNKTTFVKLKIKQPVSTLLQASDHDCVLFINNKSPTNYDNSTC